MYRDGYTSNTHGESSLGLREQRKRQTYATLRDIGLRLFLQQGFDATTVEQIAEEARVSLRSFYRYFPRKEALLFSTERVEQLLGAFRQRPLDEPLLTSLRIIHTDVWHMDFDADEDRRSLRRQLMRTHHAVRTYSLEVIDNLRRDAERVASERLDTDPATDPRPEIFGHLWASLARWTYDRGGLGANPATTVEQFVESVRHLLADASETSVRQGDH